MGKLKAVLCAAALVLAACSGDSGGGSGGGAGGGGASGDSIDVLLAAAEAVQDAGTSKFEMTTTIEVSGQTVDMVAEGAFDYANETGRLTAKFETPGVPAADQGALEMIIDGDFVYMKGESLEPMLGDAEWGRVDAGAAGVASGQFKQDPSQFLEWLRGTSGDVQEGGEEDVRGEPTTHYSTDLTLEEIAKTTDGQTVEEVRRQLGDVDAIPVDVWIDEDGLPRRVELEIAVKEGPAGPLESTISIELFDYGTEVDAEAPEDFKDMSGPPAPGTP